MSTFEVVNDRLVKTNDANDGKKKTKESKSAVERRIREFARWILSSKKRTKKAAWGENSVFLVPSKTITVSYNLFNCFFILGNHLKMAPSSPFFFNFLFRVTFSVTLGLRLFQIVRP